MEPGIIVVVYVPEEYYPHTSLFDILFTLICFCISLIPAYQLFTEGSRYHSEGSSVYAQVLLPDTSDHYHQGKIL